MTLCDRFVPAVETHAALLATLPDAEIHYGPLFYGALETVLKVDLHMMEPSDRN